MHVTPSAINGHTPTQCSHYHELYLQTKLTKKYCVIHPKSVLLQGGFCSHCYPNLQIVGIIGRSFLNLENTPNYVEIYKISNSNVIYPSSAASTSGGQIPDETSNSSISTGRCENLFENNDNKNTCESSDEIHSSEMIPPAAAAPQPPPPPLPPPLPPPPVPYEIPLVVQ